jgi:hypothetical protein
MEGIVKSGVFAKMVSHVTGKPEDVKAHVKKGGDIHRVI